MYLSQYWGSGVRYRNIERVKELDMATPGLIATEGDNPLVGVRRDRAVHAKQMEG